MNNKDFRAASQVVVRFEGSNNDPWLTLLIARVLSAKTRKGRVRALLKLFAQLGVIN